MKKMHKVNHYFGLLAYFALSKLATDTKDEELIQKSCQVIRTEPTILSLTLKTTTSAVTRRHG